MIHVRVAGTAFDFTPSDVERAVADVDPEPIREHYVKIGLRRYSPKQVLAAMTGLDRADFTTHQARSILIRLGFAVHRRGQEVPRPRDPAMASWPHSIGGHSWEAEVGFGDPWPRGWGLLGQRSFFHFFTVTFRTADFQLDLAPA